MSDTTPILRVSNLSVAAGGPPDRVPIVHDVSFEIGRGEILGIVGESGSGKTMTALSIPRILPSGVATSGGQVVFDGEDLTQASERRLRKLRGQSIAVVFQDPMRALNPVHRVGRQVAEPLRLHRLKSRSQAARLAETWMERVGIPAPHTRTRDYPFQFSGGMRQRALISMALACQPRLLIADEPTTGLDLTIQVQIMDLIKRLTAEFNMAAILISHDLNMVASVCDRVQVMYAGRIVETGPTRQVLRNPRHPYTKALARAVPAGDQPPGTPLYTLPGIPADPTDVRDGCSLFARCSYRRERCSRDQPELLTVGEHHRTACWVSQVGMELNDG